MHIRERNRRRRGAALLEATLVLPILLSLMAALVAGGMGVFRYQQTATLAREGARYASVRGAQYAADTGNAAASATDVYNNAIVPMAAGLDLSSLTYSVTWPDGNAPAYASTTSNPPGQPVGTTVVVTVNYAFAPAVVIGGVTVLGGITLTSTSIMPMHY